MSSSRRPRPTLTSICIDNDNVSAAPSAKNIGAVFDEAMSLVPHVTNICKTACFHLRAILKIRQFLDKDSTILLLHVFVISRLDYCNSLLFGPPDYVINRLQLIQNSAAHLVFCARKHDHVTPLLVNLHWLPVQCRIQFKILLMTFKVLRGEAPSYLCDLITPYVPTRTLRSQNKLLLHQPCFHLKSYGRRAFKTSVPSLWNDLPYNIKTLKDMLTCNCRDKRSCPLDGKCNVRNIIYQAEVTTSQSTANLHWSLRHIIQITL